MDKIAKIRQEIERLKDENNNIRCNSNKAYCQGYDDAFVDLLPFLDTLSEEPDKGLEEAAAEYEERALEIIERNVSPYEEELNVPSPTYSDAFIAGAEWQKEQMLKDAIPFYEILKAVPPLERENTRIIIVNEDQMDASLGKNIRRKRNETRNSIHSL